MGRWGAAFVSKHGSQQSKSVAVYGSPSSIRLEAVVRVIDDMSDLDLYADGNPALAAGLLRKQDA